MPDSRRWKTDYNNEARTGCQICSVLGFVFILSLQAINAIDARFAGELGHAADGLVCGGAAGGAGGEVHLAFCVLVH